MRKDFSRQSWSTSSSPNESKATSRVSVRHLASFALVMVPTVVEEGQGHSVLLLVFFAGPFGHGKAQHCPPLWVMCGWTFGPCSPKLLLLPCSCLVVDELWVKFRKSQILMRIIWEALSCPIVDHSCNSLNSESLLLLCFPLPLSFPWSLLSPLLSSAILLLRPNHKYHHYTLFVRKVT